MGARGFNIPQEGHVVQVLPAASVSGGVTGQLFHMKYAAKCNIIIQWGATPAVEGAVQIFACTDNTGTTKQPINFDRFQQLAAGQGNDILQARQYILSGGYTPSGIANTVDVLHLQADQIPQGYPYLQLSIADGTNADYAAAVAVLSGVRYQGDANQSATL